MSACVMARVGAHSNFPSTHMFLRLSVRGRS